MELSSLNEVKFIVLLQETNNFDEDQQLLDAQLLEQNRELREAHEKSLNEMEELKKFQGSTFDTFSRRRLIEDRDTILELTGKILELQMKLIVWMIREIFKMLNQYAVDNPTLPVNQLFPTSCRSWRNAKPFSENAEPQQRAAQYLGHAWYIGKSFCTSNGVFFNTFSARVKSLDL